MPQSLSAQALYIFTGGVRMAPAILEPGGLGSALELQTHRQVVCLALHYSNRDPGVS